MKNTIKFTTLLVGMSFILVNSLGAQTDINMSTNFQGYSRTFRVHIPPGYLPAQPIPLVFVFHGAGISNSLEIKTRTRFHLIGDTANFITIFPQALLGAWADSRGTPADLAGIDDVGFTTFILDTIESLYNIDPIRIYAAGMSTGGVFCQRLALQLNSRITAFASVGASLYASLLAYFPPARKIPVLLMNGTSDTRNLYYGGVGLSGFSTAMNTDTATDTWASFDNCFPSPTIYDFPDINTTDLSTVTRFTYDPCQSCSEVVLYRINNGGHTWPGGLNNNPLLGIVNHDINGSHEIWLFFKRHQLDCSGADAGEDIIALIESLELPHGLKNSLTVKIENALASCANGNENAAVNQLNAFINQVNAKRGNALTNEEADQLIAFAQAMIEDMMNGTADCGTNLLLTEVPDDIGPIQNSVLMDDDSGTSGKIQFHSIKKEKDNQDHSTLITYPNPASTELTIDYTSRYNFSFEIINLMGETVLSVLNENTIDVSELPDGIYFLQVMDSPTIMTKKILIQH